MAFSFPTTITLNRPEKLNALNPPMREALVAAFKEAERDPNIHVVVLKGNGRAFCVGVDLFDMTELNNDPGVKGLRQDSMGIAAAAARWAQIWALQKPVLVQAHGYCVAWGLEIAMFSDIVIAAEDAQFGFPSVRNGTGLPDSSMAIYYLGPQWAKRLLFTGDFIDGKTAERIGMVLKAVPAEHLEAEVNDLAARIATVPVDLLAASKGILNKGIDLMGRRVLQEIAVHSHAIARADPMVSEFGRIVREEGVQAAIAWREKRRAT